MHDASVASSRPLSVALGIASSRPLTCSLQSRFKPGVARCSVPRLAVQKCAICTALHFFCPWPSSFRHPLRDAQSSCAAFSERSGRSLVSREELVTDECSVREQTVWLTTL